MAIDNRKNDFIVRVLREFCREDTETVDTVASAGRVTITSNMLDRAILSATLNDDSETLEGRNRCE